MSRIYEALQRASLERQSQQEPAADSLFEPASLADSGSPTPAVVDLHTSEVARYAWSPSADTIPCMKERGAVVEQFRGLRSRLAHARREFGLKTVLISSGQPSEGKSFVAINLAVSLARHAVNRVLLIDGDLRRPTLHHFLGTRSRPGLSEYLASKEEPAAVMQRDKNEGKSTQEAVNSIASLTFIPAGECNDKASDLAANGRMASLVSSLAESFDWILIDSAPVLAVTDAVDLARAADGVLLVARHGVTGYEVIQRAQAAFRQTRVLGVVLNAAKHLNPKTHYYYSNYYQEPGRADDDSVNKDRSK